MNYLKRSLIVTLALMGLLVKKVNAQSFSYSNPYVVGVNSCNTSFTDYRNTSGLGNSYGNASPEACYRFTLTEPMQVSISTCSSAFDTYLWLLNASGNVIASDDDHGCGGNTSFISSTLSAGTYTVVAEGYSAYSGELRIQIDLIGGTVPDGANMSHPIIAGTFNTSGTYTNTLSNANNCLGNEIGEYSNDIYYKFTLTNISQVSLSHCGSNFDTYMHLLDASGNILNSNDDGTTGPCPSGQAYIHTTLTAGTYYVVSEGYEGAVGNIVTTIDVSIGAGGAPSISYPGANISAVGSLLNLSPTNTGGAVAAGGQSTSTFAIGSFSNPLNVALDASGNLYVADNGNRQIKKITAAGSVSVLAGAGYSGYADGTGTSAVFRHPFAVAVDASGNIFVSDQQDHRIRKITPAGVVTTFAGTGSVGSTNGTGTGASFNNPMGLAFDAAGNLYVADSFNQKIRKITPSGVVTTFAGTGSIGSGNGAALSATFNNPMGVTIDGSGNLYVADRTNHIIRKINTAGIVSTLAGAGVSGYAEGTGTSARFSNANSVAVDALGTVYLADHLNNRIRKITSAGVVTTLAGTGTAATVNGTGSSVSFNSPYGICIDAGGNNLYLAENGGNVIRKVALLRGYSISPTLPVGLTFNNTTGVISGTPTSTSAATMYTVTASNESGTSVTTFMLTIGTALEVERNKNWIYTKTYDDDGNLLSEGKAYSDGAGKGLQNQVKSLSTGQVLANQTIYDASGRPSLQTLAAPINNTSFGFKSTFVTNALGNEYSFRDFDLEKTDNPDGVGSVTQGTLGWYYSNNNTNEPYAPATTFPYSRADYYNDGTGAVKRSASAGDQLKMGTGHEQSQYVTPVINELDHYLQIRNKFFPDSKVGEVPSSLAYQAVQNTGRDANGKESVVITDKSGNALMSAMPGIGLTVSNAVSLTSEGKGIHYFKLLANSTISFQGTACKLYDMANGEQEISLFPNTVLNKGYYKLELVSGSGGNATMNYSNTYSDISYNFYNQLGQLTGSIAPEGVKAILNNGLANYATFESVPFITTYEYDLKGQMIANTQTDAGRTEFIYRTDGKIRFSQNSVQRSASPKRFSYVNYDRWGRVKEAGQFSETSTITFVLAKTNTTLQESIAADGGLTGTKDNWVKTYYDVGNAAHGLSGYTQAEFSLRGSVSWTENASGLKTWYNYDTDGRMPWLIRYIPGLGYKTIDYSYDAKGNVASVDFQKNTPAERFTHEYEYDADNRLSIVYTTAETSGRKLQAKYYYYLHGPLKRVELGNNLQGVDYVYTAQGALKSINHPVVANDPGKDGTVTSFSPDAFGMTLEYFGGDYSRSATNMSSLATGTVSDYSGNIVAQSWRSQKPNAVVATYGTAVNDPAMVTYAYDDKYQFSSNKFGAPNFGSNSFTETLNANREYDLAYDANGNIKALKRSNLAGANTANYTYNYVSNTNKLSSVSGYATYTYDVLGRMNSQIRTAGSQGYYLNYSPGGKVTGIYSDAAKTTLRVSFAYDESGNRIRKTDHVLNQISYYVYDGSGNLLAVYDNKGTSMQQKELPVYAVSRIGNYYKSSKNYQYELTDHLGNVRAVVNDTKQGDGKADVVHYSDYYPYGSPLSLANNDYRYGYQGRYAEVDKETGWNNFDLRMYDSGIGRWMNTDPAGQYHSPYVGMGNNPVASVDPDGGYSKWGATWRRAAAWLVGNDPGEIYKSGSSPDSWGYNTDSGNGVNFRFGYSKGLSETQQLSMGLRNYGGDYSNSASDWFYYIFNEGLNQYNPIANLWDVGTGVASGKDRFGNPQGAIETNLKFVSVLLSAKVAAPKMEIPKLNLASESLPAELQYSQAQLWKKFGRHHEELGLQHGKDGVRLYLDIANDIYKNPAFKRTFPAGGYYSGETWLFGNGNILRLDPQGNFRSLYPVLN